MGANYLPITDSKLAVNGDPTCTPGNACSIIRAAVNFSKLGYAPTNVALRGSVANTYDGLDIGAVQFVDMTAPMITIVAPTASSIVSGDVTLTATSSDDVGVSNVTFWYDTTHLIAVVSATSGPNTYSATWNTSTLGDGTHTLTAVAIDGSGNSATSTVSVTVQNIVLVGGSGPLILLGNVTSTNTTPVSIITTTSAVTTTTGVTPVIATPPASTTGTAPIVITPTVTSPRNQSSELHIQGKLHTGMSGSDVLLLQTLLYKDKYLTAIPNGYFGAQTTLALKAFQKAYGLDQTGGVGPMTLALLNAELAQSSTPISSATTSATSAINESNSTGLPSSAPKFVHRISLGMSGSQVLMVQQALYRIGLLTATPTGYFGQATKNAVTQFQKSHNLSPISGTVGEQTWRALLEQ